MARGIGRYGPDVGSNEFSLGPPHLTRTSLSRTMSSFISTARIQTDGGGVADASAITSRRHFWQRQAELISTSITGRLATCGSSKHQHSVRPACMPQWTEPPHRGQGSRCGVFPGSRVRSVWARSDIVFSTNPGGALQTC